jgi:hypothetical protein
MIVGRLDDRDVQIGNARQHTRRDGDTARAAADDDDVVSLRVHLRRRHGRRDCSAGAETCGLSGERHAFTAAAIRQDGLRQFGDRRPESRDVHAGHFSRDNRDIAALQTQSGGLPSNRGEERLVGGLTVGPIAKDRSESGGLRLGDVGQKELRAGG